MQQRVATGGTPVAAAVEAVIEAALQTLCGAGRIILINADRALSGFAGWGGIGLHPVTVCAGRNGRRGVSGFRLVSLEVVPRAGAGGPARVS